MLQKSSNPVFSKSTFAPSLTATQQGVMTLQGTINKSIILLLTIIVSASLTWNMVQQGNTSVGGI
ncbi:MAG TPA: Bax inhibitor-1/YccA family protein, partial [Bacteroidales bacterium]|nr:Bax inhibitor-1/YccA family protein [Bacteroidales bacterium]